MASCALLGPGLTPTCIYTNEPNNLLISLAFALGTIRLAGNIRAG
jgi:hypothetical protein